MKYQPTQIIAVMVPYSAAVAVTFLWAYWQSFDVDIFPYISPSNLIMFSIVPLFGFGISSLIGIAIGTWRSSKDNDKPKRSGFWAKFANVAEVLEGTMLLIIFIALVLNSPVSIWLGLPPVLTLFIVLLLVRLNIIEKGKLGIAKFMILFAVILLPISSFGWGKISAHKVLVGECFQTISSPVWSDLVPGARYLGKVGEHIFILDPIDNGVLIIEATKITPYKLHRTVTGRAEETLQADYKAKGS